MAGPIIEPLDLTFGIELEMYVAYPIGRLSELGVDEEEGSPGARAVIELLRRANVPIEEDVERDEWGQIPERPAAEEYSVWRITEDTDHDLLTEEVNVFPEDYALEPIELASRKFSYDTDDWKTEIRNVLNAVKQLESYGCRLLTNCATGFHVHVGNNNAPVPLLTCKKVFQLVTAFERCIDMLHTEPRIKHGGNRYCAPPSKFFIDGVDVLPKDSSVESWLEKIRMVTSYAELGKLFVCPGGPLWVNESTGHNSAYNFDNLWPDEENGRRASELKHTIEFRQHAGTLEPNDIIAWVVTVVGIVNYTHGQPYLTDLYRRRLHDPWYNIVDLLRTIQIDPRVIEHYMCKVDIMGEMAANRFRKAITTLPSGSSLLAVVQMIEERRFQEGNPFKVRRTIWCKSMAGQYGT